MSGGFFRGTSAEQDTRFSNKQAKLLKTQKFAPELEHLVDITKVKMDVVKPWIAKRATELLGFEDELLINFIYGLLEGKEINGKQVQIQLTGFMEKHTGKFMKELWTLLISAQNNSTGIPQQFLDAKEEETRKRKEESDRVLSEIQKRKEKENRDFEQEKVNNMDGGAVNNNALERKSFGAHSGDEKETDARNGFRAKNRYSKSPHSDGLSVSPRRGRPSGSISKSYSNSRSYSQERKISRSMSSSPRSRKRSGSSERMSRSPRRSITPRRKCSRGSRSPVRKSSHSRRGSISRSQYRSPSPIRRRVRSPLYRGSPSPLHHLSHSPARRKSPSRLQHRSRSPLRRRSPSTRRHRSPSLRRRHSPPLRRQYSPSPRRHYSPSPRRRRSPSPRRRRSPYPRRRRSPSPRRRRSPSPRRRISLSPRRRPPSPRRHPSPPMHRRRARSPSTSRSPTPIQRRAHGAVRRRSPSLVVHRSMSPVQQKSRSQMSSSLSPIHGRSRSPREHASLSPSGHRSASLDQRSSASPDRQGSLSRAQHKLHSPRGPMSPVHLRRRSLTPQGRSALLGSWRSQSPPSPSGRKATDLQRSASHSEKARKHDNKAEPAIEGEKVQYSAGRQPISLSPQRDEKGRNNLPKKVASSPSLKKFSSYSESPPHPRNKSPKEDRSVSPAYSLREYKARNGSPRVAVEHGESKLVREPEEYKNKLSKKTSAKSQRDSPDRSGSHCLYDTVDLEMKDKGMLRTDRNGSKVDKGKSYLKDVGDGNVLSKSETSVWSKKNDGRKSPKDDYSGSEESDKPRAGGAEKRRHRRLSRRDTATDKSSDDSQDEKREAKRRRKEEKKLRKEERHQRREERRRRKEEKRASKRKRKSKDSDSLSSDSKKHHDAYDSVGKMVVRRECYSSENEETESEKKRIEIELRERALQSLREKKGISR